jgi:A/G-specific adenine glycosylase
MTPEPVDRGFHRKIRKRLLSWYRLNKRDLPWRRTRDPYRILVSEIMLQQTQVATVIPYYRRFIREFPNVASLAGAPIQGVLKQWEGLGYYSRARNLHRAAQAILTKWRGRIPATLEGLVSLPGIGRYTAGAVGSIAFRLKVPVLDGNVRRVLCRIFAIREDPMRALVQERLWGIAAELLPDHDAGDFNQALMELGATICLPRTPSCVCCPLRGSCLGLEAGIQDRLPVRAESRPIPHTVLAVALVQSARGLLLGPRPDRGLLAGLWSFPEIKGRNGAGPRQMEREIEARFGLKTALIRPLEPVAHTFSHKRITYRPYLFQCASSRYRLPDSWRWIPAETVEDFPLPTATRKIFHQMAPYIRKSTMPKTARIPPLAAERPAAYRRARR